MPKDLKNISAIQDPVEVVNALLNLLSEKEQEIIKRRYGLSGYPVSTLASIGEMYSVTRERIRQVQCYAIKKMQRNAKNTNLAVLHDWLFDLLKESGEIVSESTLEKALITRFPQHEGFLPELKLACILDDSVTQEYNKVDFVPHFRRSPIKFSLVKKITRKAIKILRSNGDVMSINQILSQIQDHFKDFDTSVTKKLILASIKLDRRLAVNDHGVSLKTWRHVNPKTLFDKILYILNESNEPMHFSDIATKIKEKRFDGKSVSVQAVHNELINNSLFILIGRGIYALKTWGYKEGTVADVLESVLEKNGPMHLNDLTQEVLQRRKVKPITVQINLNSKKHKFRKNKYGLYELS